MYTKEEITTAIKQHFANARDRGQVLARALKVRADIASSRRRLQATYADLGQHVDAQLGANAKWNPGGDGVIQSFQLRVAGIKAELSQRERELQRVLAGEREENATSEVHEKPGVSAEDPAATTAGGSRKTGTTPS